MQQFCIAAVGTAVGQGHAPDGVGVPGQRVHAGAAAPELDGGVIGAGEQVAAGQRQHALHRAAVALQHLRARAAAPHARRAARSTLHPEGLHAAAPSLAARADAAGATLGGARCKQGRRSGAPACAAFLRHTDTMRMMQHDTQSLERDTHELGSCSMDTW